MYIQPDINPIESIWAALKKKVERKVKYMVIKNKKISQEEFLDIVRQEWHDLDNIYYFNALIACETGLKLVLMLKEAKQIIDLIIKYVALVLVFYLK